jgi:hypothetical protein
LLGIAGDVSDCILDFNFTSDNEYDYDIGSVPFGMSIYFPSLCRRLYTSSPQKNIDRQIENLLSIYESISYKGAASDSINDYKKAIAAYGLWLKTGTLLAEYSGENDDSLVYNNLMSSGKINDLIDKSGLDDGSIEALIQEQINDRIKDANITVTKTEAIPVSVKAGQTNPDMLDRADMEVTVNVSIDNASTKQDVSLGSRFANEATTSASRSVTYNLDSFDNKWLTLGSLDKKAVSYYDETIFETPVYDDDDNITGYHYERYGIIPVAYWVKKPPENSGTLTVKAAIDEGYLLLGSFVVKFDQIEENSTADYQTIDGIKFSNTGSVECFRPLAKSDVEELSYKVKSGEVYEILGNYDNAGVSHENLVSLGYYKHTGSSDPTVGFDTINGLDVQYSIVDIFENHYSNNDLKISSTEDNNTIIASKKVQGQGELGTNYDVDAKGSDLKSTVADDSYTADNKASEENTDKTGEASAAPADTTVNDTGTAPVDTNEPQAPVVITPEMINEAVASGLISIPVTGDEATDAKALYDAAAALYGAPAFDDAMATIQQGSPSSVPDTDITGVPAASDTNVAVPGLDSETSVITNPLTGEAVSTTDPAMTNQDGSSDNQTEYITPGLGEESNTSITNSDSDNSGGDTGSGDGGSDGGDSGSDGGSDDGGSGDSGSDDSGSDSGSSSEASAE